MQKRLFFISLGVFIILSLFTIYRSTFTVNNTLYFTLMDDEMISMRYAHNLAQGVGLVWNGTDRVEGITNILWALYMAFFHLFPIPLAKISLVFQITCLVLLSVNLFYMKKLADLVFGEKNYSGVLATFITATYLPFTVWVVYGVESCVLILFTTLSVYFACRSVQDKKIYPVIFLFLVLGVLVRLDFLIIAIPIFLFLFKEITQKKQLLFGFFLLVITIIGETIFRYSYYHALLPNTYFLKMTGVPTLLRITAGVYGVFQFIMHNNWLLFSLSLFALLKKNKFVLFLFSVVFIEFVYDMYIGGDMGGYENLSENRFISIVMPLFFILFSAGVWYLKELLDKKIIFLSYTQRNVLFILFIFLSICNFNIITDYNVFQNYFAHAALGYVGGAKYNVQKALAVDKITTDGATVAVVWAGTTPYFSKRTYIDLLGKNDAVIAHEPINVTYFPKTYLKFISFNPGHTKWDFAYSIGKLQPDVIAERDIANTASAYLGNYKKVTVDGIVLYVNIHSKRIKI